MVGWSTAVIGINNKKPRTRRGSNLCNVLVYLPK
jgi:hypothetical protein